MKPTVLRNLFAMIRSGTDRQRRTPVSEANQQIEANRPPNGPRPDQPYYPYWSPGEKRTFFSSRRMNEFRHRSDVSNSIDNRGRS